MSNQALFPNLVSLRNVGFALVALAISLAPTAQGQTSIKVGTVNLAQTHVLNADGPEHMELVGDRDVLFKANFVANEAGVDPARLNATLTVFAADGGSTTLSLAGPRDLPSLPTSLDNYPGTVEHSFDDSHTATIPAAWVKPGLRWELAWEVDDGSGNVSFHILDSAPLYVRPPVKLIMSVLDVEWFEAGTFRAFPANYFDEIGQKMPASDLELRRIRRHFPKVAMPYDGTNLPDIVESVTEWSETFGDGEVERSVQWASQLQKAGGNNYYEVSNFCLINHGSVAGGGRGVDGYYCASQNDPGVFFVELSRSFTLRRWGNTDYYPYKDPNPSDDIPYDTYLGVSTGDVFNNTHVGPYWGFDARDGGTFLSPRIEENGVMRWRGSPLQGGGRIDAPTGMTLAHYSDYSINRINGILDRKLRWLDADNEWLDDATWAEHGPGWYFLKRNNNGAYSGQGYLPWEGDGLGRPVDRDFDVYSILVAGSMATNDGAETFGLVYPPIGPYKGNVRTFFDPRNAADLQALNASNYCPAGGCDLSLHIRQTGAGFENQVHVMPLDWDPTRPYTDPASFFEKALNVPASQGAILAVELLHTPDVGVQGFPPNRTVLANYAPPQQSGEEVFFISDTESYKLDYFADGPSPSAESSSFRCPQRMVLTQIDASFDPQVIDSLRFGCAPMDAYGTLGTTLLQEEFGYPAEFGTVRGAEATIDCGGRMITGIHGRTGQRLDQIGAHCSDIYQAMAGEHQDGIGNAFGSTTGGSPVEQPCGQGYVVTGAEVWVNTNYGDIGDLELICTRIDSFADLADEDGDGHQNISDNCPSHFNENQDLDGDVDGIGDLCDLDKDGDRRLDEVDNCPDHPNENQSDTDGDDIGNACDPNFLALRLGEIIGRLCVNQVDDCSYFNTFDQYLRLSTLHLEPNHSWWQAFEFWRLPDQYLFDPLCLDESEGEVECFDGDNPRPSSLVPEGWYQGRVGEGGHHIVGIAEDKAWTFNLPHHSNSESPTNVLGTSFNEECLNGLLKIGECNQQNFDLEEIVPVAPIVTVNGEEYLVNSCRYDLKTEHLTDLSISVNTIVQLPNFYFELRCHSSEKQLENLGRGATSAQHLKDIFTVNEILTESSMLTGAALLGGLKVAAAAAEEGSTLRAILLASYGGLRGKFAIDNAVGFLGGIKALANCEDAACRLKATAQILMSGFFLQQDIGELQEFSSSGGLSSLLTEYGITDSELEAFLDEELEPLLGQVEEERWKYGSCE